MKHKRIAVLESRFGEHLSALLEKQGAIAIRAPALAEEPDLDPEAIRQLIADWATHPVKLAIFQTGVGVRALFEAVDRLGLEEKLLALLASSAVAVRGPKPTAVLRGRKVRIDYSAADPYTTHEVLAAIREIDIAGQRVLVHSGAVIGADGFGIALDQGAWRKIPQVGRVLIGDDVEIGANSTIDRAAVGATRIRRGAKLDNLVMVAHGCTVGEGSALAAQVGLSGSTRVGRFVRLGGQVGAAGHLTIGDGAQVAAQSGVPNDVAPGAVVGGYPAVEMHVWRRISAALPRLPELFRRVRRLEVAIGRTESRE